MIGGSVITPDRRLVDPRSGRPWSEPAARRPSIGDWVKEDPRLAAIYGFNNAPVGLGGYGFRNPATQGGGVPPSEFLEWAMLQPSLIGVWTVPDGQPAGDIANDQVVLEDLTGTSARTILAKIASTGNWEHLEEGPGTGVLGRCISTKTNRGASNFMTMDADPGTDYISGILIARVETAQAAGQRTALGMPGWDGGNVDNKVFNWRDTHSVFFQAGATSGVAHSDNTNWISIAWSSVAGGDIYVSQVGAAFGGIGMDSNAHDGSSAGRGWCSFRSFDFGGGTQADTSNGIVKFAAVAQFSADIGAAELEAGHDLIPA